MQIETILPHSCKNGCYEQNECWEGREEKESLNIVGGNEGCHYREPCEGPSKTSKVQPLVIQQSTTGYTAKDS